MSHDSVAVPAQSGAHRGGRRSTLLGVCLAFAAGGVFGSVSGFFVGRAGEAKAEDSDEELAQLRWLATEASADELVAKAWNFLLQVNCSYRSDDVLWQGVDRLVHSLPERRSEKEICRIARFAEQVIQGLRDSRIEEADALLAVLGGVR